MTCALGIIAKIKGALRTWYGRWATRFTISCLNKSVAPDEITLPFDAQSNKKNLSEGWSVAQGVVTSEGIVHCWEACCDGTLLSAWTVPVQKEAVSIRDILFPNLAAPLSLQLPQDQGVEEVFYGGPGVAEDLEGEDPDDFIQSILADFD